ncbi:hypothetical protein KUTeg_004071 [Tegillarca granosa]|uniref:Uncharacterized protein n=1 Tax=Tegillarca granosa TaxID=220873 RepID=A0ABQ9FP01_TEGGR|nr:hypothetical protein KUTeg_004071 [Tegillarca granosa]
MRSEMGNKFRKFSFGNTNSNTEKEKHSSPEKEKSENKEENRETTPQQAPVASNAAPSGETTTVDKKQNAEEVVNKPVKTESKTEQDEKPIDNDTDDTVVIHKSDLFTHDYLDDDVYFNIKRVAKT